MGQDETESIDLPSDKTTLLDGAIAGTAALNLLSSGSQSMTSISGNNSNADAAKPYEIIGSVYADRYEVFTMLGKGGMSVVYKARHLFTKKFVALKILHSHLAHNETTVMRFRQEAQTSGTLLHPGIISVQDFGVCEGAPYLVMDYIEGRSLAELIKQQGNLSFDRFVDLMLQVAAALDYAHRNQVIHRDLKPSNIMVSSIEDKEQAKIVDFGLAKVIQNTPSGQQQLTQTGELFGSPLYMSPEQCSGRVLDARSDIYALGCVMYEALCGHPPFSGETVFETINKHLNSPPPPLSAPQLETDSRQRIELLILKCLAKDVDDRFSSAGDVMSELRAIKLTHRGGVLAKIQNSWNLSRARRAARAFDMLPILLAVACISCLLSLWSAVMQNRYRDLLVERNNSYEIVRLNNAMYKNSLIMQELGHEYALKRDPKYMESFAIAAENMRAAMKDQEATLKRFGRKDELRKLRRNSPLFTATVRETERLLRKLEPGTVWTLADANITMQLQKIKTKGITSLVNEPKEEDEVEKAQELTRAASQLGTYSTVCFYLNTIVLLCFVLYYFRARKLRHLAERAVKLAASNENNSVQRKGSDDITEIDSALEELAEALTNAEHREKVLLAQIKSRRSNVKSDPAADDGTISSSTAES